jgi:hypothetical protein
MAAKKDIQPLSVKDQAVKDQLKEYIKFGKYTLASKELDQLKLITFSSNDLLLKYWIINTDTYLLAAQGRFIEAAEKGQQAIDQFMISSTGVSYSLLRAKNLLSWSLSRLGENLAAIQLSQQAYEELYRIYGPYDQETINALNNIARFSSRVGNQQLAISAGQQVLSIYSQMFTPESMKALVAKDNFANYLCCQGEIQRGLEVSLEVERCWIDKGLYKHPHALTSRLTSLTAEYLNNREISFKHRDQLIRDFQDTLGREHSNTIRAQEALENLMSS